MPGSGCGIGTHTETCERARQFTDIVLDNLSIKELIGKHLDAFRAGSPYPDAYYPDICYDGNYHGISEDTHWTPFLKAGIEYVRETYPKPWDEETEKLVVFLLGVVGHQVADVSWHALGIDQGFLETMGKVNYHGSFDAAHSDGDFGGDVLTYFQFNMDYLDPINEWYVPTQDLSNIYRRMYQSPDRMPLDVIENCTSLIYLGLIGEGIGVIDLLYPEYAEASPFLVDRFNDFFLGGIDDMAIWSENIWKHTVTMLDQGTGVCNLPKNPLYITCNSESDKSQNQRVHSEENPGVDSERLRDAVSLVYPGGLMVRRTDRGMYLSYDKEMLFVEPVDDVAARRDEVVLPSTVYSTDSHYSRLGEALLIGDLNNDGFNDLTIGAPSYGVSGNYQKGRVYVIYGSSDGLPTGNLTVENDADLILEGSELNGRFGASLAVADINQDGQNDLIIGAPSTGSESLQYQGAVYVYYGGAQSPPQAEPNFHISCSEKYCNLGWSLTAGDLNNDGYSDLVVGAPYAPAGGSQRGFVGVLYSKTGGYENLTEENFDWRWNGEQDFEWLGYSVLVTKSPDDGEQMLAVGAPTYRICARSDCRFEQNDLESVGKLYTFRTPLPDSVTDTYPGSVRFSQMGYNLVGAQLLNNQVLAISSVTGTADVFQQSGTVSILESFNDIQPSQTFIGDREFGRFGANVEITDVIASSNNDVIISAPFRSETIADNREEGRVFIFNGDTLTPIRTADEAELKLGLGEDKARFGSAMTSFRQNDKVTLAISAPYSGVKARLGGRVAIYTM